MQVGGNHYETMDIQPWDAMEASSNLDELKGYHINTVIGYLMRRNSKGGDVDIRKAAHHMQRLIQIMDDAEGELKPCTMDRMDQQALFNLMDDEQVPEMPKEVAGIAEILRKLTGADVSVREVRVKKPETSCDGGCTRCSASRKGV